MLNNNNNNNKYTNNINNDNTCNSSNNTCDNSTNTKGLLVLALRIYIYIYIYICRERERCIYSMCILYKYTRIYQREVLCLPVCLFAPCTCSSAIIVILPRGSLYLHSYNVIISIYINNSNV